MPELKFLITLFKISILCKWGTGDNSFSKADSQLAALYSTSQCKNKLQMFDTDVSGYLTLG